ncbi:MAG: CBS domain-containing protein [Clostridia bacterium]|nr:CBS domain-containing protein [Clostridia bacterium]
MTIKDIMTDPAVVLHGGDSVFEAARVMREHNIGAVPVVDGESQVVGIITDRDIVIRDIARGLNPKDTPVSTVMTGNVKCIAADTEVEEAASMMSRDQVRRIPVVEDNRIVGLVSLGDIATCMDYKIECADALCEISRGCHKK